MLNICFDSAKNASNIAKHGVSLALAERMDWDVGLIWPDIRQDYGEPRWCVLAPIGNRLFFSVFVDRQDGRRVISLRKANNREQAHYANLFRTA